MSAAGYEPVDLGDERRLERFGPVLVDRPAPAAVGSRRAPAAWADADARFEREGHDGRWTLLAPLPDPWRFGARDLGFDLELRPAAAGQLGAFPEQAVIWRSLASSIRSWRNERDRPAGGPPAVLSLFAYTGAATLACAAAGATVVHVDASRTAVAWARRNAAISDLAASPVRWIAEDARSFVAREARRGRRYDGIVLDPPSYGHGPDGRAWWLERDLEPLLETLAGLVSATPAFVALSAHTRDFGPERLIDLLGRFGDGSATGGSLELVAVSGARLTLGAYALWSPA
jgi:23S rRNA (cytosine1962-C5)-methyltransferase